jgi:hypothetical protein
MTGLPVADSGPLKPSTAVGGTIESMKQVGPQFQSGGGPFESGGGPGGPASPASGRGITTMDPPMPPVLVPAPAAPPAFPPAPATSVRSRPLDGAHPRHTNPRPT